MVWVTTAHWSLLFSNGASSADEFFIELMIMVTYPL